jgi:adenylate cyclase
VGREIERKFLVLDDGWRTGVERSVRMRQAYLNREGNASVRVRIEGAHANLNIKSGSLSIERQEFEYPIPLADGEELLALCVDTAVEKTRHYVPCDGHLFEVDEFEGANAGLVVAELELTHSEAAYPKPAWLGEDVSLDERYYNVYLARYPYRDWGR